MSPQSSIRQRWSEYRPSKKLLLWSCAASSAATILLGFVWGGWVTGGRATTLVAVAADGARADLAATICVNRFVAAPEAADRITALRKNSPWFRGEVLETEGWVKLPGLENISGNREPVRGAADLCAARLMTIRLPPNPAPDTKAMATRTGAVELPPVAANVVAARPGIGTLK